MNAEKSLLEFGDRLAGHAEGEIGNGCWVESETYRMPVARKMDGNV